MHDLNSFEFVPLNFLPARVNIERRDDGTLVLRSPEPLGAYARCLGEHLERWAQERPDQVYLAQRDGAKSEAEQHPLFTCANGVKIT